MNRPRARYLGGLVGCLLAGAGTLLALYYLAPAKANAGEQGPQRWLLLGGACVLPLGLFYGWAAGSFLTGRVWR